MRNSIEFIIFRPNPMFDGNMGLGQKLILRIQYYQFISYTRRASAAQLRINIHTCSRVISIAHPVLTIPYVWRVTHEYINEGLKQGLKNEKNSLVNPWATSNQRT